MGWWTFALSCLLTAGSSYWLVRHLPRLMPEPRKSAFAMGWPPALVLVLIMVFYSLNWIPPVPLSMQYGGIYHQMEKVDHQYRLIYPEPPWTRFWQNDSRFFLARPGDSI